MSLAHVLAFNLALLAALVSPGPAMPMALRTTLVSGRRAGILFGLGLGAMAAAWTGMALMGLHVIFDLFPWIYTALKIIGAAYLIWMAISTWRNAAAPVEAQVGPNRHAPFLGGVLVNLANPKSILFAAAVLVVIFPPDMAIGGKLLIVFNQFAIEGLAYFCFAMMLSTGPARAGYLRLKPLFDRLAAAVLGALGLRLLLDHR